MNRAGFAALARDVALVRSVRAAVVIPGLFAFADKVIGNPVVAVFASLGGFAALLLADFGGPPQQKLRAYASLGAAGAALILIGTACSESTALSAIVAGLVALTVLFSGVFSSYAARGSTAALLLFMLPTFLPAPLSNYGDRVEGWALAIVVGTAAVFLTDRKRPTTSTSRRQAATVVTTVAALLESAYERTPDEEIRTAALRANASLRAGYLATPFRPTGAALPEQALTYLIDAVAWLVSLTADPGELPPHGFAGAADEDRALIEKCVEVLRSTSAALEGIAVRPDIRGLETVRRSAATAVAERASAGLVGDGEALEESFHARSVAYAAAVVAATGLLASGAESPKQARRELADWLAAAGLPKTRIAQLASGFHTHASLRSVWLRNSIRAGVGIALAVLIAKLTGVQHGFWVVLGTLSVLRSNALGTGSTVVRALIGTVVGFIIGGALVVAIGVHPDVLWAVLPVAVLIAGIAPVKISFAGGQAAFTVLLAILFNIVQPAGWRVGLVRVEDIAIGCAISLGVGLMLWPRGAAVVLANDLAEAYRAGLALLDNAIRALTGTEPTSNDLEVAAEIRIGRLDDAVRAYLAEQGPRHVDLEDLSLLVAAANRLLLTTHSISALPAQLGARSRGSELDPALIWAVGETHRAFGVVIDDLEPDGTSRPASSDPTFTATDGVRSTGNPGVEATCSQWILHHLEHLRESVIPLPAAATNLASGAAAPLSPGEIRRSVVPQWKLRAH